MKTAQVCAIITCFNEGPYIGEAVRSILGQTKANLIGEIIIADDGSDDATIAVLKEIENWDVRIKVYYGKGGARQAAQRNIAVDMASCEFIAFLDGDDLWTEDKLEKQVEVLKDNDDVGLVYGGFYTFPDGNIDVAMRAKVIDLSQSPDLSLAYFLNDPPIMPSTVLMRRELYLACGRMDAAIHCFEETEFYLRLARTTKFSLVQEPLLYKRNHPKSVSTDRKDHMAYHAFVALKSAAQDPRLLPFVPQRLSERARKLGNHRFLMDDRDGAINLLWFALQMNIYNHRAWITFIAARFFPRLAHKILGQKTKKRQRAMGVS